MKGRVNSLSVVLPAFNEEVVIAQTVRDTYARVNRLTDRFEVIVVNDGSRDATAERIKELQKELPKLVVVNHEINRGYGEALRSGFNTARYEWIFQMDADGQFRIDDIERFLPETENFDVVVGYRERRMDPWYRDLLTWGYMSCLNILFDLPVRDVGCAFKLFKRQTWHLVQPIESHDHKIFLVEWIDKLKKARIEIKELPVRHYARRGGRPTGAKADVVWAMVKQLVNLKLREQGFLLRFLSSARKIANSEWGEVVITIVGVKLVIFIISMAAFAMFNPVPDGQSVGGYLAAIWNRWDTLFWYVNIAENGYDYKGFQAIGITFLPFYPLLIRIGGIVTGNYLWSALWIANILSVLGLLLFYQLARLEFDKRTAWWALLALLFFPSAYFFNAGYTEGLFLVFAVGSFFFARRGNWPGAGVLGGLAALTRIVGVVLWPALLVEFLLQKREKKQSWGEITWLLTIPGALVVYLIYNVELFGFAFAFMGQLDGYWQKHFAWPWVGLAGRWQAIDPFPYSGGGIVNGIAELGAGMFFIVGTLWSLVSLRLSYTVYLACLAFMVLSTNILQSTPRYLLAAFPLFFLMGRLGKFKIIRVIWLPFAIGIMTLFMTHFVLGWGAF